jgi:hypothetical protein
MILRGRCGALLDTDDWIGAHPVLRAVNTEESKRLNRTALSTRPRIGTDASR